MSYSRTDKLMSGIAILCIVTATVLVAVTAIELSPFDRNKKIYLWLTRIWSRIILGVSRVTITLHGLENIKPNQTYVVAANHQSFFDIPATLGFLPLPLRMLAKKELFYIPIFGWAIWAGGHISLDRGKMKKSLQSIRKAGEKLKRAEASIMVYPEGTRSPDGQIHRFKRGAFHIAVENNLPVLPVAIKGSRRILAKNSYFIHPGNIDIIVAPPVMPQDKSVAAIHTLKDNTRETIISMFNKD